jgi:carboxyl-terminal processing protease
LLAVAFMTLLPAAPARRGAPTAAMTLPPYPAPRLSPVSPAVVWTRTPPDDSDRWAEAFDEVWKALDARFYDENLRGLVPAAVSKQAIRQTYRERVRALAADPAAGGDDGAFALLVNEMLGKLNASHTWLFTPDDFEFAFLSALFRADVAQARNVRAGQQRPTGRIVVGHIGAMTRPGNPAGPVAAVINGSPADLVGIRPGDVLVSVNGAPYRGLSQFARDGDQAVTLVYRRGDKTQTVRVAPVAEQPIDALLRASQRSIAVWDLPGGKKAGYLRLWTMADGRFAELLEQTVRGPLHDTDGLILDLRDGFGGRAEGYADVFFRPDVREWRRERNGKNGQTRATGYNKPLVVLVNGGTRSAKEMLAWTLQRSGRATLIGQNTAGAVLASQGQPIANGRFFLLLAVTDLTLDGERLEGRGVRPNTIVTPGAAEAEWRKQASDALAAKLTLPRRPSSNPNA